MISALDVALIPFRTNEVGRCADPLKVYEYCAMGRPVVSTLPFDGGSESPPILLAPDADAFARAIRIAIDEDSPARHAARVEFARRNTWSRRVDQLLAALAEAGAR